MVTWEVKFCECRKSPNNIAFDEAVKRSRISQALSVWPFSMLLYWKVWTHPLLLCSFPVHSLPVAQWQLRTKNTTLLFSLYIFFPFGFPFFPHSFFKSNWDWSKHNQPISATSRGTVNPYRSQGSPAKFGAFQFSFFYLFFFSIFAKEKGSKLACRGVRLCWLQKTDALQEFWKQTRLTLFSRPWLLFSLLFWRY